MVQWPKLKQNLKHDNNYFLHARNTKMRTQNGPQSRIMTIEYLMRKRGQHKVNYGTGSQCTVYGTIEKQLE